MFEIYLTHKLFPSEMRKRIFIGHSTSHYQPVALSKQEQLINTTLTTLGA